MKRLFISFANFDVAKQNLVMIAFIEERLFDILKKSSILRDDPQYCFYNLRLLVTSDKLMFVKGYIIRAEKQLKMENV